MKAILFLACMLAALSAFPQTPRDTTGGNGNNSEGKAKGMSVSELFAVGEKTYKKANLENYSTFKGHWKGFHFGFMNFANLPDGWEDMELDMGSSFSMQFNFANYSVNLNSRGNIGLVTGLGIEYQRFRFSDENITLIKEESNTIPVHVQDIYTEDNIDHVQRSSFKNLYLTIPFIFEVQFPAAKAAKKRIYASAGFMGGVRMHSKTKIVYRDSDDDKQKEKMKGNFHVVPFKVDVTGRIGYRNINIWGSYTLTNLFKSNTMPDLKVYTLGFGLLL